MISAHLDHDQLKGDGDTESDSAGGPSVERKRSLRLVLVPPDPQSLPMVRHGPTHLRTCFVTGYLSYCKSSCSAGTKPTVLLYMDAIFQPLWKPLHATNKRKNDSNNGDDSGLGRKPVSLARMSNMLSTQFEA